MHSTKKKTFLLTVDVEDWFQVENFKTYIPYATWDSRDLRVERNTHRLLDLFDDVEGSRVQGFKGSRKKNRQSKEIQNSGVRTQENGRGAKSGSWEDRKLGTWSLEQGAGSEERRLGRAEAWKKKPIAHRPLPMAQRLSLDKTNEPNKPNKPNEPNKPSVRATFFILGWIAERLPGLVREIHDRGHEVASHGFGHEMCSRQSPADLKADLVKSKKLLENIIGDQVCGYRAPSFSINNDILKIIEDAGYLYDSSYNSFDNHGRYGKLSLNGFKKKGIAFRVSGNFCELPISNLIINNSKLRTSNWVLPWGGGGYFRLMPYVVFKKGIQRILTQGNAYNFYLHPWELDPDQPRVEKAAASLKFRHYVNLKSTADRIRIMLDDFRDCRFVSCREYIIN